ncbi:MAG: NADH-ubiquinone oxidoreductase-F iron-sulfur binding region domain-containing protein [Minisyncoccales bacterium]
MDNIINKLKKHNLLGRSGSGFPTSLKWEMVKNIKAKKKYIICNAAEGEPDVFKDGFILENYPEEAINGIKIALKTIDNSSAYIYLRKDYYQRFKKILDKLIKGYPITLFQKKGGYLAGEETCVCEVIEGKKPEPRIKPPFPTEKGLFSCPTLINNLETFYCVSKIAKNEYKKTRFYCISGDVKNKGVYELPEDWPIRKILKETKNLPGFDFFVQAGGGAAGEILLSNELNQKIKGIGGIIVFDRKKTNTLALMNKWAGFFHSENCDKCVPCREGIYRIKEMLKTGKINQGLMDDLIFILEETSFCSLGKGAAIPFKGLIKKLYD